MSLPPRNCTLTLREPFLRDIGGKFYLRACIDGSPEREVQIKERQQLDVLEYLILVDKKLTNAVIRSDSQGRWVVLKHSPAADFFNLVDDRKEK